MLKRILLVCLCIFLETVFALGQMTNSAGNNYRITTTAIKTFDNTANFTIHNVWHPMASAPQLADFASGSSPDGSSIYSYGIDPAGNMWEYKDYDPAHGYAFSWVQHPEMGTDNSRVAVGYGGIFKVSKGTYGCSTTGGHLTYKWSGSAWVQMGWLCATSLSIGDQDGYVYARRYDGKASYYTPNGWGNLAGGPYQSVVAASQSLVYVNDSTGRVFTRQALNNTTMVAVSIQTPVATGTLAMGGAGILWFSTATQAYVFKDNTSWIAPIGYAFSRLTTAGPLRTFAIYNGAPYRFADFGLQWDANIYGNYTCIGICPPPPDSLHTLEISFQFAASSLQTGGGTGPSVFPSTNSIAAASATAYEPFSCLDVGLNPAACFAGGGGAATVLCNKVGQIFRSIINFAPFVPTLQIEFCQGTYKKVTESGCHTDAFGFYVCNYTTVPYCTAATSPPDAMSIDGIHGPFFHNILQKPGNVLFGGGGCDRLITTIGVPLTPWFFTWGFGGNTPDFGPGNCTKHP